MIKSVVKVCFLTGIAALFLLSCAILPAGFESVEEKVIRHTVSGMEFPPRVSGFDRINPTTYDDFGQDVSVGYVLDEGLSVEAATDSDLITITFTATTDHEAITNIHRLLREGYLEVE